MSAKTIVITDIAALAAMDTITYGKTREASSKAIGVAVGILDRAIKEEQTKLKAAIKAAATAGSGKEDSAQLKYAQSLNDSGDYAGRTGVIFKWVGTHWEAQNGKALESEAIHFCAEIAPDKTCEKLAQSAVATAALFIQPMPEIKNDGYASLPIIPTRNGYLEVGNNAIKIRDAKKEDGLTYVLNCAYDPFAECSNWLEFLEEALPNKEVRDYLQEYVGYTLLSDTRHEIAAWLIGEGGTGKGTSGTVVQALHRKVVALDLEHAGEYTMAAIVDASLIYIDETPKTRIPEQAIKSAISGDKMSSNIKNRDPISFCPTGKWWLQGNHLPPLSDHTSGFWRRFIIFPFNIKPKSKRPMLAEFIIETELEGVLNWSLEGLQRLLKRKGFDNLPEEMQQLKDDAMMGSNGVASWADESEVVIDEKKTTSKDAAYSYYRRWSERSGMKPVNKETFSKRLGAILPDLKASKPRHNKKPVPSWNITYPSPYEDDIY